MAEGAMRALVAWYISPALHMCALFTCSVALMLSSSTEECYLSEVERDIRD